MELGAVLFLVQPVQYHIVGSLGDTQVLGHAIERHDNFEFVGESGDGFQRDLAGSKVLHELVVRFHVIDLVLGRPAVVRIRRYFHDLHGLEHRVVVHEGLVSCLAAG